MGLTLSAYGDVIKRWYRGPIIETLTKSRILLAHIKRDADKANFKGNEVHTPVHYGRNVGVGARPENIALPTAGNQQHTIAIYNLAYQYARIRLTGQVMAASDDSMGAFAKALNVEMKGALQDALQDHHRQLWHDGSGRLTDCNVTSASTTVQVNSTKYLEVGMIIDIRDIDDGTPVANGDSVEILTIPNATTFTVGTAVTTAVTDAVYRADVRTDQASPSAAQWGVKGECWGLEALVSASGVATAQGLTYEPGRISRTTYPKWQANEVACGGALSFAKMQEAWDEPDIQADGVPRVVLTTHEGRRSYGALFDTNRRYVNTLKLKGGFTGLEFNGTGVFADRDCTATADPTDGANEKVYMINLADFCYYVKKEWDWIDQGGSILHWVTGYDAHEAVLRAYMEFAIKKPNAQVVLTGVTNA